MSTNNDEKNHKEKIEQKKLEQIRNKNIESRALKQKKLEQKATRKIIRNELKNEKSKKYAEQQTKRKERWISSLIKKIKSKYDQKILDVNKSLEKHSKNSKVSLEEKEKLIENNLIVRYYRFFLARIKKKYDQKIEKVKYDQEVLKILDDEAKEKINNIEIERHLSLEYYNKKIENFKNHNLVEKRLTNKMSYFKNQKNNEIIALEQRMKVVPSTNLFSEAKDNWANFKSIFVFGMQIKNILSSITSHLRKYSMVYILLFVVFSFYIATDGKNMTVGKFILLLDSNAFILIIGMGMLMVIVSGNIDLSVGALMGFLGAFSAFTANKTGNIFIALTLTLLIGALVGLVQGFLIGYGKMPSFIVTLGGMLFFRGLSLWLTESKTIIASKSYQNFIKDSMPDVMVGKLHIFAFFLIIFIGILMSIMMFFGRKKRIKYGIGHDNIISFMIKIALMNLLFIAVAYGIGYSRAGLRYYIVYVLILAAVFTFIMQNTSFGRKIYAVGGNSKAAILSGINKSRIITYVFIIIGMMVGFASIVFTAFGASAGPAVSSGGYELDVIASVFVGGASMQGGVGTIQGSVIGALILGYINGGMDILNLQSDSKYIVKAIVLVSAVGYDIFANRKIG